MKNKKSSLILKICIITLMIILSTIGIVWAVNNKTEHITGIKENESYYDAYKVDVSVQNKPDNWDNATIGFSNDSKHLSKLEGLYGKLVQYSNVLCCQHHTALNDASGYWAEVYNVLNGSPAQSYILAHMPGDGKGEYTDVQYAWWTMIDRLGIKGVFESALSETGDTFIGRLQKFDEISNTFNDSGWNMLDIQEYKREDISYSVNLNSKDITQKDFEETLLQYKDMLGIEIEDDEYKKIFEYIIFTFQPAKDKRLSGLFYRIRCSQNK